MNKWTVLIIGTLVFLGIAHYLEDLEIERSGEEPMIYSHYGEIEAGKLYYIEEVDGNFTLKEIIKYDRGFPFFGETIYPLE